MITRNNCARTMTVDGGFADLIIDVRYYHLQLKHEGVRTAHVHLAPGRYHDIDLREITDGVFRAMCEIDGYKKALRCVTIRDTDGTEVNLTGFISEVI